MPVHIMLDLETWGTRPGYDIRSIGACVFDPVEGITSIPCQTCKGGTIRGNVNDGGDCSDCLNTRMQQGYGSTFYIATNNPLVPLLYTQPMRYVHKYPLHRDPNTELWWSEQSYEAQAAFTNPVDLRTALERFAYWFDNVSLADLQIGETVNERIASVHLWSHGAAFDLPILAEAYHAVNLPVPWLYRAPRDTRTLFDVAGITDHSAWLNQHPGPLGVPHHALDDAICQAQAVCAAWKKREF